tara:strand:+ start:1494 stop:2390 length:897 start_codon:yes stop_codon:yes gene_type:complete
MATATRPLLIVMTAMSIPIYLVFIVPEGLLMQAAGAVLILLLVSMILFTGRRPAPSIAKENEVVIDGDSTFRDIDLPAPVLSEEKTSEIRDSKIRRSRGRQISPEIIDLPTTMPMPEQPPSISMVDTDSSDFQVGEIEETARVHVAKADPEIQAEAEVDRYLDQQRQRREIFRERLHKERRLEKSKRMAEEAVKWTEVENGEDLSTLTSIPGHGLAVMYEPEEPDNSIPQGISYIRIDDGRILKVRVSLDAPRGMEAGNDGIQDEVLGVDMPPLPSHQEMPIPPPPASNLPPPVGSDD